MVMAGLPNKLLRCTNPVLCCFIALFLACLFGEMVNKAFPNNASYKVEM